MLVILFFTFCNNNRYYLCEYFLLVQDQKERATMTKRINKVIVKKDSSLAISQLRKEKGITQAELADVLGISVAAVSLYEQGIRFPSKEMAQKICDYFNCDMNYLYGLSPIKNSLLQTNLKGRDIAVYDRRRLVDDGAGLSKTNKAIFDIEYTVSTITLPVSVALKDKAYFGLITKESTLTSYGLSVDNISIFFESNAEQIIDNKIVCALVAGKIIIRKFVRCEDGYLLYNGNDDENPIKILSSDENEHIVGQLAIVISNKQ